MIRLIKIEFRKLLKYKAFWIIYGLHFVLFALVANGLERFKESITLNGQPASMITDQINFFGYPEIWHNLSYLLSWFLFFLAVIIISFVSNEFSYKTLRQNIIDGMSKWEVIFAKEMVIVSMVIGSLFFLTLTVLFFGSVPEGGEMLNGVQAIFAYGLSALIYLNFAFLVAVFIKRAGLGIGFLILYAIAEKVFLIRLPDAIREWLPLSLVSKLIPNPYGGVLGFESAVQFSPLVVGVGFLYIGLFLGLIYLLLQRGHASG